MSASESEQSKHSGASSVGSEASEHESAKPEKNEDESFEDEKENEEPQNLGGDQNGQDNHKSSDSEDEEQPQQQPNAEDDQNNEEPQNNDDQNNDDQNNDESKEERRNHSHPKREHRESTYEPPEDVNIYETYSEGDCDKALDAYWKKKEAPPFEMLATLIAHSHTKSCKAVVAEDYDTANKYQDTHFALIDMKNNGNTQSGNGSSVKELEEKLQVAKDNEKEIRDRYDEKIKKFNETHKEEVDALNQKHEEELNAFETKWTADLTIKHFSKPTPSLIQVRYIQTRSALAKQFQNAKQCKNIYESQQKQEGEVNQQRYSGKVKIQYMNLAARHDRESECLQQNYERRLKILESQRDNELEANQRSQSQYLSRSQGNQITKRPTIKVPVPKTRSINGRIPPAYVSPRTKSSFTSLRKEHEVIRVPVSVVDPKTITRPKTSSAKK